MRKFFIFVLFFSTSAFAEVNYIPPDNSFSFAFWFNHSSETTSWKPLVIIDSSGDVIGTVVMERDYGVNAGFRMTLDSGLYDAVYWFPPISDGPNFVVINYGSGVNVGDPYQSSSLVALYLNGSRINLGGYTGNGANYSYFIGGYVSLGEDVFPGTFYYSSDVLTPDQIRQGYDFGQPGTVKYMVNRLFWEVIKYLKF